MIDLNKTQRELNEVKIGTMYIQNQKLIIKQ